MSKFSKRTGSYHLNLTAWLAATALLSGMLVVQGVTWAAPDGQEQGMIVVDNQGTMVTFGGGTEKAGGQLSVSIDGPDGHKVFEGMSKHGIVDWTLNGDLADGVYRYDVWFASSKAGGIDANATPEQAALEAANPASDKSRSLYKSGRFEIRGGIIESQSDSPTSENLDLSLNAPAPSGLERLVGFFLNAAVPAAHAGVTHGSSSVTIDGTAPAILFDDTDRAGAPNLQLLGNENGFWFATPLLTPFFIDIDAPGNALYIEDTGDIGMGTNTPATRIEIRDDFPNISLVDTDDGNQDYELLTNGGSFFLSDRTNSKIPFGIHANASPSDSSFLMWLSNGGVAIGGFVTPLAPLHVRRTDGSSKILVQETNGTPAARELFKLSNNGGPFFIFENTDISQSYSFAMGATGDFLLSHQQTSGVQMRLTPSGNMTITGSYLTSSSRATKDQVVPVDAATVLDKVDQLPIAEWSYLSSPGQRHVGPMAEDWHAAFGLGPDDRHVSPTDMAGVALAAVKALREENSALKQENLTLLGRIERIESSLGLMED